MSGGERSERGRMDTGGKWRNSSKKQNKKITQVELGGTWNHLRPQTNKLTNWQMSNEFFNWFDQVSTLWHHPWSNPPTLNLQYSTHPYVHLSSYKLLITTADCFTHTFATQCPPPVPPLHLRNHPRKIKMRKAAGSDGINSRLLHNPSCVGLLNILPTWSWIEYHTSGNHCLVS